MEHRRLERVVHVLGDVGRLGDQCTSWPSPASFCATEAPMKYPSFSSTSTRLPICLVPATTSSGVSCQSSDASAPSIGACVAAFSPSVAKWQPVATITISAP